MKSQFVFFLILFLMIFSNTETDAQKMPPIEPGVSQTLAKWRAANYSDIRYKLNLTIEKKAPTLEGTIEISLKSKSDRIILDWRKIKGSEELSKVKQVSINNVGLNLKSEQMKNPRQQLPVYEEQNEHLIFIDGVVIGENTIKIEFESPILTSGSAITRYIDKEDGSEYIYSLFVPSDASTAFPVFDQPDLKARFSLTIKAPQNWKVISNSNYEILSPMVENDSTESFKSRLKMIHQFKETKPISTYVFAFAAGAFVDYAQKIEKDIKVIDESDEKLNKCCSVSFQQTSGSKPILNVESNFVENDLETKIYVRKSQAEKFKQHSKEVFRLNREAVKYFEDYFDYKFPFPKYDLVLIPEFPFGGMEHAGATFLRESSIIFPTEPTANDYISRASLIFHEAAHQWFGDTVTMKWFDDLWLKEGFATFMAYKAMEKLLPEYDIWKVFYERTKQRAYLTDVTRGTTPIYQEIPNLSSAKSAYGNIVYQKAPSFLKQAEFYLGEKEFQTAVRAFLKKHEFANAEWSDLVNEFQFAKIVDEGGIGSGILGKVEVRNWAETWVNKPGTPIIKIYADPNTPNAQISLFRPNKRFMIKDGYENEIHRFSFEQIGSLEKDTDWIQTIKILRTFEYEDGIKTKVEYVGNLIPSETKNPARTNKYSEGENTPKLKRRSPPGEKETKEIKVEKRTPLYTFPNYQDYGYGIFLLDEKSKKHILENIQNEKDDFLRSMMWGSLWDSVRFYELDPKDYVELVIKNLALSPAFRRQNAGQNSSESNKEKPPKGGTQNYVEEDVVTISSLLSRISIAMTYYLPEEQAEKFAPQIEKLLLDKMKNAQKTEQKITFYRAFLNLASSDNAKQFLKSLLSGKTELEDVDLKTKDKFDIVTRLIILGDADAPKLLAELEKTETSDAAKRYAYAARAGFATKENKAKFWNDFVNNKEISESWIEDAFAVWNTPRHSELTLPYLEKALAELPNLKRNRKIFFVNGWLAEFIGGQKSREALDIVNKFLEDNPKLDEDLRRKILENVDGLERAVKIRSEFGS